MFTPDPDRARADDDTGACLSRSKDDAQPWTVTIVCVSRLAYRKGIDLLIAAIPLICAADLKVRFIIGAPLPLPNVRLLTRIKAATGQRGSSLNRCANDTRPCSTLPARLNE